jgi:hypothetical protein
MKHLAKIQLDFLKFAQDDMSGEVHKEREKRIELSELPEECKGVKPTLIKQGKLRDVRDGNKSVAYARIRMMKEAGADAKYSLGVKHLPLQQEAETDISQDMFDCFYPNNLDGPQEKLRYSLPNGWDVDQIVKSSKDDGKIFAEYEHNEGENVGVPSHWKIKD